VSQIIRRRIQEVDLPTQVDVLFINKNADYQQGVQQAKRIATKLKVPTSVRLPIVLTDDDARKIAEVLLYDAWVGRETFSFKLGRKYAYLEPTDVVNITDVDTGTVYSIRITRKVETRTGPIDFEGVADTTSVYTARTVGIDDTSGDGGLSILVHSTFIPLDVPLLRDADADFDIYIAVDNSSANWPGAAVYRSLDAGASFNFMYAVVTDVTAGYATNTLGVGTTTMFDEASTVNVRLTNGELSSTSELSVLNGANAMAIGKEVLQFREATLEADGTYTLFGLLRGRRGTEEFVGRHISNEIAVLLDYASLRVLAGSSSDVGQSRSYKAVTAGLNLEDAVQSNYTNIARAAMPYSPVHFFAGNPANSDWNFTWIRRARKTGDWLSGTDVPLGEESESYRLYILSNVVAISAVGFGSVVTITSATHGLTTGQTVHLSGFKGCKEIDDKTFIVTVINTVSFTIPVNGTAFEAYSGAGECARVRRTIAANTQAATYTAAEQVTDFGGNQTAITARVVQVSATIGDGRSTKGIF